MPITELFNYFKNRNEQIRQEIASETGQFIKAIQPYADKMDSSKYWLDLIRSENRIGDTGFRSIMLRRKEDNRLVCWFLQSGSGFKTGDLQVTMTDQPASPLSFKTIEVFKFSRKEERHWLPLKPVKQLINLKLANECLGIVETFRSGTKLTIDT